MGADRRNSMLDKLLEDKTAQKELRKKNAIAKAKAKAKAKAIAAGQDVEDEEESSSSDEDTASIATSIFDEQLTAASGIFKGISTDMLRMLDEEAKLLELKPGEELELKKTDSTLYVVRYGAASVTVEHGPPMALGPGTAFNMVNFLGLSEDAEPFNPARGGAVTAAGYEQRGRTVGAINTGKTADAAQIAKKDLERLLAMRPSAYNCSVTNAMPVTVFAERRRTVNPSTMSTEKLRAQTQLDDGCNMYNLCPTAVTPQPGGKTQHKLSHWLSFRVHGGKPDQVPVDATDAEPFEDGGCWLLAISQEQLDLVELEATFDESERGAKLRSSLNLFQRNCHELTDTWRLVLGRMDILASALPPEITWSLAEICERSDMEAGEIIIEEGDYGPQAEDLIFIDEGFALVEKFRGYDNHKAALSVEIGRLGPGAVIGDLSLMGANLPRPTTVRAKTMVEVLTLPSTSLLKMFAKFPGIITSFESKFKETAQALQGKLPVRQDAVASLKLFAGSDHHFINEISSTGERQVYYAGQVIKKEGSTDGTLYALEHGSCTVEVLGRGRVATVPVGNCFGDRTLMGAARANATVRAFSPVVLVMGITQACVELSLSKHHQERRRFEAMKNTPQGITAGRLISHIEVFKSCCKGFIEHICSFINVRTYLPAQTMTVEGQQDASQMFALRGGAVAVEAHGVRLSELSTGSTFGELSMLGAVRRRQVTCRALCICFVMEIPREAFLDAIEYFPEERGGFEVHAMRAMGEIHKRWAMLPKAPPRFLYLLNLYAERIILGAGDEQLKGEHMRNTAVLVLEGEVTLRKIDTDEEIEVLQVSQSWNEECFLEHVTDETVNTYICPEEYAEVLAVSKAKWDEIIVEFPEDTQQLNENLMQSIAKKMCRRRYGVSAGHKDLIRMSNLFKPVSDKCAEYMSAVLEAAIFRPNETIVRPEDLGDRMYILIEGEASVQGYSWTLPREPGSVFGEAELLGLSKSYNTTVVAETLCVCVFLSQKVFREVLNHFPDDLQFFVPTFENATKQGVHTTILKTLKKRMPKLGDDFADALASYAEHVFIEPGGVLLAMREECGYGDSSLYVLFDGAASVEGNLGVQLGRLKPGDWIGEGGALGLVHSRTATVRAEKNSGLLHVIEIAGPALERALQLFAEEREQLEDAFQERQESNVEFSKKRFVWLRDTVVPALRQTGLLAGCPSRLLAAIAAPLAEKCYEEGDMIACLGEEADAMLLLLEGEAQVLTKAGHLAGFLTAGAAFAEVAALGLFETMTADIVAASRCRVLKVTATALRQALSREENAVAREAFDRLIESRRLQVERGMPLAALGINVPPDDLCARVIALQAEFIPLEKDQYWNPISNEDPCGPHLGIFVKGDAMLELDDPVKPRDIVKIAEGSLVQEGIMAARGTRIRALSRCEGYRIKVVDFQLAISSCPEAQKKWLHRFELLEREAREAIVTRLNSVRGATTGLLPHPCDGELHKYRGRRQRAISRAQRMKQEVFDLPKLPSHLSDGLSKSSMAEWSSMMSMASSRNTSMMMMSQGPGIRKHKGSTMSAPDLHAADERKRDGRPKEGASRFHATSMNSTTSSKSAVSLPQLPRTRGSPPATA
eukprot:TRINITY_DN80794_c0_g1_i1.p1 TRINITY_DN80794_c0_g1~~TRINITY_DN80794_c0_g1_i1.p1  ORF type:complete len:1603 (+),score=440.27 TRINITY_DN80794_c0_g1_i1:181-4989(+)